MVAATINATPLVRRDLERMNFAAFAVLKAGFAGLLGYWAAGWVARRALSSAAGPTGC